MESAFCLHLYKMYLYFRRRVPTGQGRAREDTAIPEGSTTKEDLRELIFQNRKDSRDFKGIKDLRDLQ